MMLMAKCELCGSVADEYPGKGAWTWFDCIACGRYQAAGHWRAAHQKEDRSGRDFVRLRGVVRRETDEGGECKETITTESFGRMVARHDEPMSPLEQMDRLLVMIADRAAFVGAQTVLKPLNAMARRLYVALDAEMSARVQTLQHLGFGHAGEATHERASFTLNLAGWERADRLRKTPKSGDQAFVAMWFHTGMDPLFDDGIVPALKACGYSVPFRVDRSAHTNKIDDEIVANIRKSRLLVADLTGIRPNVFYELGFAMGLGIPVILTCSKDWMGHFVAPGPNDPTPPTAITSSWFKQVSDHAFDVRQYPTLTWETPSGLAKALKDRVEALGLALTRPASM